MKIVVIGVAGHASATLIDDAEPMVYPHGITDTHEEQLGNDPLALLNSTGVRQLVGSSTRKDDA